MCASILFFGGNNASHQYGGGVYLKKSFEVGEMTKSEWWRQEPKFCSLLKKILAQINRDKCSQRGGSLAEFEVYSI